jgi:hypothetical protein
VRLALLAASVLVLGLAGAAGADEATMGLPDAEGDGGEGDVVNVIGVLAETAFVQVLFTRSADLEDIAIRGVLVRGEPNAAEPTEWYQFTVANVTHAFAAHGVPRDVRVIRSSWNGSVATLEFERSEPSSEPASCVFAVVESGTFNETGFEVFDAAPLNFTSVEGAWPVGACPGMESALPGNPSREGKGSPGLALPLLAGAVAAAAFRRRR